MPRKPRAQSPERAKTDDSLRTERMNTDDALKGDVLPPSAMPTTWSTTRGRSPTPS